MAKRTTRSVYIADLLLGLPNSEIKDLQCIRKISTIKFSTDNQEKYIDNKYNHNNNHYNVHQNLKT